MICHTEKDKKRE